VEGGIRFKCSVSDLALPMIAIASISIMSGCSLMVNCRLIDYAQVFSMQPISGLDRS
jgi:hypothetical protein